MSPARLFLIRAGFILGCVLPTVLVAGWVCQHLSPRYWAAQQEDWQRVLSQRLGLKVEVTTVAYPTIHVARLGQVRLLDPESGTEIARIRSLEMSWTDECWTIELSQPELHLSQLPAAWKELHERLFRQADGKRCEVTAGELTLHGEEGSQTITNWQAIWQPGEDKSELVAQGLLAGSKSRAPLMLSVVRDRRSSPPLTTWSFNTSGAEVPCLPAADDLPLLAALGKDCKFNGQVQVALTERGWQGEIRGKLLPVDLDRLVTEHLPHKLSGLAEISLERCQFAEGRIQLLSGTVESNGGYVGRSLLGAATTNLAMQEEGIRPASTDGNVYYRRMAFGFLLGSDGLTVKGQAADPVQHGVVITAATSAILLEPSERTLATNRLLTLLGNGDPQALANPTVESVRRALPLHVAAASGTGLRNVRVRESAGQGSAIAEPGRFER